MNVKRLGIVGAATVAASIMAITGSNPAFATDTDWHLETTTSNHEVLRTSNTLAETHTDGGSIVEAWRGADNNNVWLQVEQRTSPFTIDGGTTNVAPSIAAFANGAVVFRTAPDGQIWYSLSFNTDISAPTPGNFGVWIPLNGQSTFQTVSVTRIGGRGSRQLFIAYRSSNDQSIITDYSPDGLTWQAPRRVPNIQSPSAPSVVWNPRTNGLYMTHEGTDRHVYASACPVGSNTWAAWRDAGSASLTESTPAIGVNGDGRIAIAIRTLSSGLRINSAADDPAGRVAFSSDLSERWRDENVTSPVAPGFSANSTGDLFGLRTAFDSAAWYRDIFPLGSV